MKHIGEVIRHNRANDEQHLSHYTVSYFRNAIDELREWSVSDAFILRHRALLLEYLRQQQTCARCQGFHRCGKEGDMQGFTQHLTKYHGEISVYVQRCEPFHEYQVSRRVERVAELSGALGHDGQFRFSNFPNEQRRKYPALLRFAEDFADSFQLGGSAKGLYLFGPPGVGKTHLMLAVFNRLRERGVPCLVIRSDTMYDRMRHIIAEEGDLEPLLEAYAAVPVLGIDEFAQERANDFTLEKLFRIINHRFHEQLPTWFTSNYAPPQIFRKNGADLADTVGPLRSRIMQMAKMARIEGEDARQKNLESLT